MMGLQPEFRVKPLLARVGDWKGFLLVVGLTEEEIERIRRHESDRQTLGR